MTTTEREANSDMFAEWVVLELMGHRRLAGYLQEVQLAGDGFLRLDVYPGEASAASMSQLYRPASVYCITPTTEEIARKVAAESQPAPVARFELERAPSRHEPYDRGMAGW